MAQLSLTLSGSSTHTLSPAAMWHARAMVLAWGVLMPLGALVARFFKVLPGQDWPRVRDHKAWWHTHRALQWMGLAVMVLGLWLIWDSAATSARSSRLSNLHAWAGWAVCVLGALQALGALARGSKGGPTDTRLRGDHYDMTPWRLGFERAHKSLGWLAVVAGVAVMLSGLVLVDAPRWMALTLGVWWFTLAALFVLLQRAGFCIDTYQAIWGPDPRHPGNQRRPIGWGVRRPKL